MCKQCEEQPWGECPCGCGKARGKRGCTAHAKSTGLLCGRRTKSGGLHVCWFHGGQTPIGPASHAWVHGDKAKHFPTGMMDDYEKAVKDPERFNFEHNIGVLNALISREIKAFTSEYQPRAVEDALVHMARAEKAANRKDRDTFQYEFAKSREILSAAAGVEAEQGRRTERVGRLLGELRQTVRDEQRRQAQERMVLTGEAVVMIQARLANIITKHITDQQTLELVIMDLHRESQRWRLGPAEVEIENTN